MKYKNRLTIKVPIFSEGAVGIDLRRTTTDCYIDISFELKDGSRMYDNLYVYRAGNNHKYKKFVTKYGNTLVKVPISELEVVCKIEDIEK